MTSRIRLHQHMLHSREDDRDDRSLVEQAQRGDAGACEALVRVHYPDIQRVACQLLGNAEDGADLAQDCFVRAWTALADFRGQAQSFRGWLRRILVHLARDRYRRRARRPADEAVIVDPPARRSAAPGFRLDRAELRRAVDGAVERLPVHLRVPLVLRAIEGWSYEDVAEATGVTPATARTQVMKARRRLHRALGGLLEEVDE